MVGFPWIFPNDFFLSIILYFSLIIIHDAQPPAKCSQISEVIGVQDHLEKNEAGGAHVPLPGG